MIDLGAIDIFSKDVLACLGILFVTLILFFILITVIALLVAYVIHGNREKLKNISSGSYFFFLNFALFMLDLAYVPAKKVVNIVGGNPDILDRVSIDIRNVLWRKKFSEVPPKERIVILPQCLRSLDCKTTFSSIEGAKCLKCGKCKICKIVEKAEKLGYKGCYIAPGGGFVRRILEKVKPKAVIGIACPYEVNTGMIEVSNRGIAVQGVVLLRSGCVETDIDLDEVFHTLELGCKNEKR